MGIQTDYDLLEDVFKAYYDARQHKRNTINQLAFEVNLEENLIELTRDIQFRTYQIGRSVCFIVNHPVKREIFAADFRDRIVHHLIFNYTHKFFEKQMIDDCYSCRKGYGTSYGVKRLEHHLRSCTDNYQKQAYVLKLDLQGYFMSINRGLLYDKLEMMLTSPKNKDDKMLERELYLLKLIVHNDPTDNCFIKGNRKDWQGLPASKSLFTNPKGYGLPIGNLTSQLFSNIYLNDFDHYVKRELRVKHYGRYVDDFFMVHPDKWFLLEKLNEVRTYLSERYQLTIHPKKIYLQNVNKGVNFLGAYVKPHRVYVTKRAMTAAQKTMFGINRELEKRKPKTKQELELMQAKLNSYLGYLGQFKTYKKRMKMMEKNEGIKEAFRYIPSANKCLLRPESIEGANE